MQKGQQVVLWVLAYCIVSWWGRGVAGSPSPLIAPARVAELFAPRGSAPQGRLAMAPQFTRPMQELISVPVAAAGETNKGKPAPGSWDGFIAKLRALEAGHRDKVRVVHLGDSELVADGTAGSARRVLAARFGLGGLGFSLPLLPLPWYHREHLKLREGVGIRGFSYPHGRLADGMFGPGGVAFDAAPGAHAWMVAEHPVPGPCSIELFFSYQPTGGQIAVMGDGKRVLEANTVGTWGLGTHRGRIDPCPRELELVTKKRQTRFYGWSIEYETRGIVWSNLGVVSAQIPQLDHYAAGHLEQSIGALQPDLVVMTFGLNIAASPSLPPAQYRFEVRDQLRRIREGAPNAACVVTGPYPVGHPRKDTGHNPESRNAALVSESQREAAEDVGCTFIDRFALAGGLGTAQRWVGGRPKMLSGDFHHLTVEGGERMGRAFARVITAAVDGEPLEATVFQIERQEEAN